MGIQVVWFKRDLRWQDHAALTLANQQGPVRCIYIHEPELWQQADAATQHWDFIHQSLLDLADGLAQLGVPLEVYSGDPVGILKRLHAQAPIEALHSHQETGNRFTYERDKAVARWCHQQGVPWREQAQFGVVRALKHRSQWQPAWETLMAQPLAKVLPIQAWQSQAPAWPAFPALTDKGQSQRQRGGRLAGLQVLQSFLDMRCAGYRGGISSPLIAPQACSRLSPHLAYGCLSMREVVQATRQTLAQLPEDAQRKRAGLQHFMSRLYWHCHFIQKLESEPDIEWRNMHSGYDGLREPAFASDRFEALKQGRTGWPMVDACVAMLNATGWLNFRMRAMLVSVAAYPLWLHWRPVGEWLATQFLDYEPGIHWSQMQMQAGTTGINTTRVYNPIKQARDHDPKGVFVRRWLPYMRKVPDDWLFEPWRMPPSVLSQTGLTLGKDLPVPLVDLESATRWAKQRLHERRRQPEVQAGNAKVIDKHASRLGARQAGTKHKRSASSMDEPSRSQLSLDF
jgi:deoxyribodipyrimidine photo-lyase